MLSVPPVAVTYFTAFVTSLLLTACHPLVASAYIKVTAIPSVFNIKSCVKFSIFSEPSGEIVQLFVSNVCA